MSLRQLVPAAAIAALVTFANVDPARAQARAQAPDPQRALLDRMAGHWVLRGTLAGKQTTHDVDVSWVLNKEYLQIREVSRERDSTGGPSYDAIVYIAWDPKAAEYAVLWLDNTATWAFTQDGIGHAKPAADRIPFVFKDAATGIFHNTMAYDRKLDQWTWTMDNEDKGTLKPFARLMLTRK